MNNQVAWIFDLDGTLCNVDHRLHHVRKTGKKDWKAFFEALPQDSVNLAISDILDRLCLDYQIILCSGRPEKYRTLTMGWLGANDIQYDKLFMRQNGDYRPDNVVKEEIYLNHIEPNYTIMGVFDDRQQVVDMWRSHGLTCLQCAPGDF